MRTSQPRRNYAAKDRLGQAGIRDTLSGHVLMHLCTYEAPPVKKRILSVQVHNSNYLAHLNCITTPPVLRWPGCIPRPPNPRTGRVSIVSEHWRCAICEIFRRLTVRGRAQLSTYSYWHYTKNQCVIKKKSATPGPSTGPTEPSAVTQNASQRSRTWSSAVDN